MISQKQLSLADIFEDCKDIFESDKLIREQSASGQRKKQLTIY